MRHCSRLPVSFRPCPIRSTARNYVGIMNSLRGACSSPLSVPFMPKSAGDLRLRGGGGMRRVHLRGHPNILKRLLVHVAGCGRPSVGKVESARTQH